MNRETPTHLHLVTEPTADLGLKLPWRPLSQPADFKGQTAILAYRDVTEGGLHLSHRNPICWIGDEWIDEQTARPAFLDGLECYWLPERLLFEMRDSE